MNVERQAYQKRLSEIPAPRSFTQKIVRYFPETFMGNGHSGLSKIAHRNGINVNDLAWGEYVIFVNKKQTALKLYSQGGLIAHLKMPGSARIEPKTIALIPRFFNGSTINYDAALKRVIREQFGVQE